MKIDKPENSNYAAVVVTLKSIVPLPNCDNVVGTSIFGYQAIVSKDHKIGDIGIVFPAETQLSDEFCSVNNLYRHGDLNKDKDQKGYMEDNRRVRAIKFRSVNTSSCLFMPLSALAYTGIDVQTLREGDEFDTLNGKEICRKYVVRRNTSRLTQDQAKRKFERVDKLHMPEHIDTVQFFKVMDSLDPDARVVVTQKLHGTSIRIGHTIVKRKLKKRDKLARFFGAKVQETEHDYVYGSRKVIKDANNPDQVHYYTSDLWTDHGKKLVGMLPENYLVYAELVGWTPDGAEIQKSYTYAVPKGQAEMYIYRIAIVNSKGHITDLSWSQVKEFCRDNGLKYVPEIAVGRLGDIDIKACLDTRYFEQGIRNALWLGENKDIVDEGVCIRIEGRIPQIYKAKSPKFFEHETAMLDTGAEDLESSQNETIDA